MIKTSRDPIDTIAFDIGVIRYVGEDDDSFRKRTVYSALRFIVSAACIDDGFDAQRGISKRALTHKTKTWVLSIDNLYPGIFEWLDGAEGISALCSRLIEIGEILSEDRGNRCLATKAHVLNVVPGQGMLVGFYDASEKIVSDESLQFRSPILSGLSTIVSTNSSSRPKQIALEDYHLDLRPWDKMSHFGEVEYLNPMACKWSLYKNESWSSTPIWIEGLAIARIECGNNQSQYFIAKPNCRTIYCSPLQREEAIEINSILKKAAGNESVAIYEPLDSKHVLIATPLGFVPAIYSSILQATTWPTKGKSKRYKRIARKESLPLLAGILNASNFKLRESHGSKSQH